MPLDKKRIPYTKCTPSTIRRTVNTMYENFNDVKIGSTVWVLHKGLIMSGILFRKVTTISETRDEYSEDDDILKHTLLSITVQVMRNPMSDGFEYLEVTTQPVAVSKEALIDLITFA